MLNISYPRSVYLELDNRTEAYLLSLRAETTVWVSTTGVFTGDADGTRDIRKLIQKMKEKTQKSKLVTCQARSIFAYEPNSW